MRAATRTRRLADAGRDLTAEPARRASALVSWSGAAAPACLGVRGVWGPSDGGWGRAPAVASPLPLPLAGPGRPRPAEPARKASCTVKGAAAFLLLVRSAEAPFSGVRARAEGFGPGGLMARGARAAEPARRASARVRASGVLAAATAAGLLARGPALAPAWAGLSSSWPPFAIAAPHGCSRHPLSISALGHR